MNTIRRMRVVIAARRVHGADNESRQRRLCVKPLKKRGQRLLCTTVAAIVAASAVAAPAFAGVDRFFSGPLNGGAGFDGYEAHSVTYIEGDANHNNFCIAIDQGRTGPTSANQLTTGPKTCSTSGGFANQYWGGACCYHGFIGNYNSFQIQVYSSTHTSY